MSLFEQQTFDYIIFNPAGSGEDQSHPYPHTKIKCPGFTGMQDLLPYIVSVTDIPTDEYDQIKQKATSSQTFICAFIKSHTSIKDLAVDIGLNLRLKNQSTWYYLWFIAPRIQTYLMPLLNKPQKQQLFGSVAEWWFYDEEWQQDWISYQNKSPLTQTQVVDLTPTQWQLIEQIPRSIRAKYVLDNLNQRAIEDPSLAYARSFQNILNTLSTPLAFLKYITSLNKKYPIEQDTDFEQFLDDYLLHPEKAQIAFNKMTEEDDKYYLAYSHEVFER